MSKPRAAAKASSRPRKLHAVGKSDLGYAREVVEAEARAVANVAGRLDDDFARAVAAVSECRGQLVVTGMGKAGFLAQRLSAIFASVGIPSLYLHPADAAHGDLGPAWVPQLGALVAAYSAT